MSEALPWQLGQEGPATCGEEEVESLQLSASQEAGGGRPGGLSQEIGTGWGKGRPRSHH